jgi:hypothetical protein
VAKVGIGLGKLASGGGDGPNLGREAERGPVGVELAEARLLLARPVPRARLDRLLEDAAEVNRHRLNEVARDRLPTSITSRSNTPTRSTSCSPATWETSSLRFERTPARSFQQATSAAWRRVAVRGLQDGGLVEVPDHFRVAVAAELLEAGLGLARLLRRSLGDGPARSAEGGAAVPLDQVFLGHQATFLSWSVTCTQARRGDRCSRSARLTIELCERSSTAAVRASRAAVSRSMWAVIVWLVFTSRRKLIEHPVGSQDAIRRASRNVTSASGRRAARRRRKRASLG